MVSSYSRSCRIYVVDSCIQSPECIIGRSLPLDTNRVFRASSCALGRPFGMRGRPLMSVGRNVCACVLDAVCYVVDKLDIHGYLWHTGSASVDDGNEGAVQLVHVALGKEPASRARLVLHLRHTHTQTHEHEHTLSDARSIH